MEINGLKKNKEVKGVILEQLDFPFPIRDNVHLRLFDHI